MSFRIERDTMGEMKVPADALYGASTARAIENFPVAHEPVPAEVIHAFGYLKAACPYTFLYHFCRRYVGVLRSQVFFLQSYQCEFQEY